MDGTAEPVSQKEGVNWAFWFGVLALSAAMIVLVVTSVNFPAHEWTPVRIPISLVTGMSVSTQFNSETTGDDYEIQLVLQRRLLSKELEHVLDQTKPPDLSIQVWNGGRPVPFNRYELEHYRGENAWANWSFWSDEDFGQIFGSFHAAPGQRYTIRARVRRAASELRGLDPHLEVTLAQLRKDAEGFPGMLLFFLFLLLLVIGIPSLVVGIRQLK
jgi:hypothetical protein